MQLNRILASADSADRAISVRAQAENDGGRSYRASATQRRSVAIQFAAIVKGRHAPLAAAQKTQQLVLKRAIVLVRVLLC
jgi:hypothetical protein